MTSGALTSPAIYSFGFSVFPIFPATDPFPLPILFILDNNRKKYFSARVGKAVLILFLGL